MSTHSYAGLDLVVHVNSKIRKKGLHRKAKRQYAYIEYGHSTYPFSPTLESSEHLHISLVEGIEEMNLLIEHIDGSVTGKKIELHKVVTEGHDQYNWIFVDRRQWFPNVVEVGIKLYLSEQSNRYSLRSLPLLPLVSRYHQSPDLPYFSPISGHSSVEVIDQHVQSYGQFDGSSIYSQKGAAQRASSHGSFSVDSPSSNYSGRIERSDNYAAQLFSDRLAFLQFPTSKAMPAKDLDHGNMWTRRLRPASTTAYEVVFSFADDHQELIRSVELKMVTIGISVFTNDVNVHEEGYQIEEDFCRATDRCKICIPILSKPYLSSARCLHELAYIWESRKNIAVIPIFFDVDPCEISFLYTNCMTAHKVTNEMSTVLQWQKMLREVSEIEGWELEIRDGNINEVINLIVNATLNKLRLMNLNPHPVIMEDQIKEVKKLLDIHSGSVLFVGIHGVSGVGKTSLAEIIFNEFAGQFEGCSFLHNIQEASEKWGLKYVQDQLWRDTADRDINHEKIDKTKNRLLNKKVLIVLDDVNQREQINGLVGKTSWLGSGSRIIVTTQDIRVLAVEHDTIDGILKWPKEVRTFEMRGVIAKTPSPNVALQLFRNHAFGRDSLPADDHLSERLVEAIGGIALALEIIGSFLNRKPTAVWDSTLERLRHVHPLEVKEKLLISFESLAYKTRQIFLDIACFFCHKDKTLPIYMWDACNFFPRQGLEELKVKCLVKIREDNKLWMHDQVKEFGREMARIESFNVGLAQCSRLWVDDEALDVLRTKKVDAEEKIEIEALSLGCDESLLNLTLTNESFERTKHLRFLKLQGVHLAGNFRDHLMSLRWLQWRSCPAQCEATNLQLYSLVTLDLSRSQLNHEWRGWSQLKNSTKLKVLNLTNCKSLKRTPDFFSFRVLERLILKDCTNLVEVHESIAFLTQLKYLNLSGCTSLNALPRRLSNLTSLLNLEMDGTGVAELPFDIQRLVKLHSLVLSSCFEIKQLPDSLGFLTLLVRLDLGRTKITGLPKSIGMLKSLQELHARYCVDLAEVPNEILGLSNLRIMDLSFSKIRSLPGKINLLSLLQTLRLESCDELQEMPELPTSLVRLTITGNQPLLRNWRRRITRWFSGTSTENIQDWIGSLSKLETLELCVQNITKLKLHAMSQLRSLSLSCQDFEVFPEFPASLSRLFLGNLQGKTKLSTLDNLEKLTFLEFYDCSITNGLESLGVGQIESLEHLSATRCNFSRLNGFNLPKRLRLLCLSECAVLHELDLTGLVNLIHLDVTSCSKLIEIRGIGELLCLEELSICSCDLVETLGNLSKLEKLEGVKLIQCEKLREVEGLDKIKSLKNLDICSCNSLENFHDIIGGKKQKRHRFKA